MNRDTFAARAVSACQRAVTFARDFAVQTVPDAFVLLVVPNSSHDKNLRPGEVVYPEESLADGECLRPMNVGEFVDFAWRDGLVPEWINVHLGFIADDVSHLEVEVCGRYTRNEALLYHLEEGYPPFHVLGPALPPELALRWDVPGRLPPFDVNWSPRRLRPRT